MKTTSLGKFVSKGIILFWVVFLLVVSPIFALEQDLIVSTNSPNVSFSYDNLDRVTTKNTNDDPFNYTYDKQYYGTLTNFSGSNYSKSFQYDKNQRVTTQVVTIDGFTFTKRYVYDSSDRVVADTNINYTYNKQGKVKQIPNFVNTSNYTAFGGISSKTYNNGVLTNYSYRSDNGRLSTITSVNVQNLVYIYDSVGNIMTINDSKQNKFYNMTYDSLDRLTKATIGSDAYSYYYDSLGRIKKINQNNQSKKLVYNGLAHAPSKIINGTIGVDLQNPHELDTNSKTRVFEFYLVNENNATVSGNFTVAFGDGSSFTSSNMNVSDSVIVLVENNYSVGGDYEVNFTAQTSGNNDYETENIKFGTHADALDILFSDITRRIFELSVGNDVKEQANNVNWNCSEGLYSYFPINISGNSSASDIIDYYYMSAGQKSFQCNITSDDGSDTISKDFTVRGLEVDDYDVLYSNISTYIITFDAKNYYQNTTSNIKVTTNNETFNQTFNISSNDDVIVITEINYSSDGLKQYQIDFTSNDSTASHVENFLIAGVSIENYVRLQNNYTNQILLFEVKNNWKSGNVSWNLTNPDINATMNISNDESVAVIIENAYTTQGDNKAEITAQASNYKDLLTDFFEVRPLQISSFEALTSSVFEIHATNNLNSTQFFNWQVDNISSTNTLNLTGDDAYIIVENSYPIGVRNVVAGINSTSYSDNQGEVISK